MKISDKNTSVNYQYILIGILVLSVIPLLILHYFNQPTPEDFYYSSEARRIGLWDSMRVLYKFYGGRYFTYFVISLNPLYFSSVTGYKILTLLLMLLFCYVFFLFVSEFTKKSLSLRERILFSLSVLLFYLFTMPSISQGFYWFVSAVHYQAALMLLMLFIIYYTRIERSDSISGRNISIFTVCLLTVAIPGTVELAAATLAIIVLVLIAGSLFIKKKISWWQILILILTVICVYFVLKSPGNDQRAVKYSGNHDLLFSVKSSFLFLIETAAAWKFNSPLIAVTVLLIPFYFKIVSGQNYEFKKALIKLFYLILIILVILYADIFIIYWSLGIPPYDRILDFIYFIFLTGWFCSMVLLTSILSAKYGISKYTVPKFIYAAALIIIAFFIFKENNFTTAYKDLFSGKASEFNREVNDRYEMISGSNSDSLQIDTIRNVPGTFFYQDITRDPKRPFNIGYRNYFRKKYIVRKPYSESNE